ncbi:TetR/AcrR family transcriptional regulator [Domibacillus indicus]|uniref:TetR/AcrR family transcriptional regulator n=1 Tax=Domibacillus indicus TaxID=1437523 RepID=UPI00203A89AA|nr:TetR/AcrR family transcriptional regulator [Domibacillus indicus]MCM3790809.1 TetR/AcrR family transcriptional regulator [Domibacillus indicus]
MRLKDENKSENIFYAAVELINEYGLAEISMSKIAKKANVSSSTIYVYFENKEDMLNKLYLSVKKKMSQAVFDNFDDLSLQTAFENCLRKLADFILNNKNDFLFIEQFSNSPLIHKLSRKEGTELFDPIRNLFEKGKKQNVFKQVDTHLLVNFTFEPVMKFAKDHFNGLVEMNQENLNKIIQMSWDAVKA